MAKKIIIIGSSIAGSSLAYLLAKSGLDVCVYDSKKRKDIGKKLCANVVTNTFRKVLKNFNIDYKQFVKTKYTEFNLFSRNNSVSFPVEDYEIDRIKFVNLLIKEAEKEGARFYFETSFIDVQEEDSKTLVKLKNKNKIFVDSCNLLVGADGAMSSVAKKAGLWQDRKVEICLQKKIPKNKIKNSIGLKHKGYNVFVGKKFGYYSYIFPSKTEFVVGMEGSLNDTDESKMKDLLKFVGYSGETKIKGALVPTPQKIINKKNIFLIGDASCQIKFTGGGIIPSLLSSLATRDIILKNNYDNLNKLNKSIYYNQIALKLFYCLSEKEFDYLLEVMKEDKFKNFPKLRDELTKKEIMLFVKSRLFFILLKHINCLF
jgi:flavin-dependent dehydrogenase